MAAKRKTKGAKTKPRKTAAAKKAKPAKPIKKVTAKSSKQPGKAKVAAVAKSRAVSRSAAPAAATRGAAPSAVTVTCQPDLDRAGAQVRVSQGEKMRYEVTFEGLTPNFSIVDQNDVVILSQDDPPVGTRKFRTEWPQGPVAGQQTHALGMLFLTATSYTFRATRVAANGAVIQGVKDCTYSSNQSSDQFFTSLRILAL